MPPPSRPAAEPVTPPKARRTVLVVGASGNVGGSVVGELLNGGVTVRVAGTDPARLRQRFPGVTAVRLDFNDPTTFDAAVDGVDGMFLIRPPAIAKVRATLNALLDRAERRGVGHVVFSSVTGADTNRVIPHHRVEARLKSSGLTWTILRPGFFAQNLADAYRADIVRDHRLYLPAGQGRAAFIDARDIGAVAAAVLTDPTVHRGRAYVLTGPEALDFHEVAAILARQLGRPISYQPASALAYVRHVRHEGATMTQALVQATLHTGLRRGQAEQVDPTLSSLLCRPPRTLELYVHEHRETWATPTTALA